MVQTQKLTRNLYLIGEVQDDNVLTIIQNIHEINDIDAELGLASDDREPIRLFINSPGGVVSSMLGLISVIESSETPIHTHAIGEAMSAALLIFVVSHVRVVYKNSLFMYHSIGSGTQGDITYIENYHEFTKQLQNKYDEILTKYTTFELLELKDICERRKDYYFDYKQALAKGLADEIEINDLYEADLDYIKENYPDYTKQIIDISPLIQNVPINDLIDFISQYKEKDEVE